MALDLKRMDLKDLDIRTVYEWPIYGRLVIFALVCVAVVYGGYLFDSSGLSSQIYTRYKQELDLKEQVNVILKSEEDMKGLVLQFPQVLKLVNQWQGQLINGANLPDLLNQILKLGAVNHLKFSLFAPGAKTQMDDYTMVPIKVVAQGGYSDIAHFMSAVANLPQLVAIGDFVMLKESNEAGATAEASKATSEVSEAKVLTTMLTLEVYYLANKK